MKSRKRYGRRLALESVSGTFLTVHPCRDCGAVVAFRLRDAHDRDHAERRELLEALRRRLGR